MDLLLGLDMLKAHQACIDLQKNVLRIQGREVSFLSEHELPDKARNPIQHEPEPSAVAGPSSATSPTPARTPAAAPFPGGGHTLGQAPRAAAPPPQAARSAPASTQHPESHIRILMDLGATREVAISSLDAAGGNIDVAASLLF